LSIETQFDWIPVTERTVLGPIYRPIALIEIKASAGDWKVFYPEVDSGSPITILNESDCARLGLTLANDHPITLGGVFGGPRPAFIHSLPMRIGNDVITARVAFTAGPNHKQLLGRVDVFDNFRISLRGRALKTGLLRE
jgi:hypothetical protein